MAINGETKIKRCPCPNKFQDKRYGKGKRVHNVCNNSSNTKGAAARCTSCGTVQGI